MNHIPPEIVTQKRLIDLFNGELGYEYLGDWQDREGNSNIEEKLLAANLKERDYSDAQINRAIELLKRAAIDHNKDLYQRNKDVYSLMRYGVPLKTEAGKLMDTIHLIDWNNPAANHFAIAEEVTLRGNMERRPDLVIYINGLAFGVLELKRSTVAITEGIRQNRSNQQSRFNEWFYSTIQFVMAGNDTEGLRYGTIGTKERYFLKWKEDEAENEGYKLDKYIKKMFEKSRVLELMHDFVLFDGGVKKLPRVHQYFAVKAAQDHVERHEGGIIWHTQGSGKSIVMVLLAKWILENIDDSRVAIITDRDELDKQIEGVFIDAGESIERARSSTDLLQKLSQPSPRLLCALVHKFGKRDIEDFEAYLKELKAAGSDTHGDIFVMVDECHRTQSGRLNKLMKARLPKATFIGFTGTPLLKKDKQTSLEVFSGYIHRYLFGEAVEDGVVLDLAYDSRDVDQSLVTPDRLEQEFDARTKGMNDWQKAALKRRWGTLQTVYSAKARIGKIVGDIAFDFLTKPRLVSERGNAILVTGSIFEACRYYELFDQTDLKDRCALITSYNPQAGDISLEDTGAKSETDKQYIYRTYDELLKDTKANPGKSKTETYEDRAKKQFVKEPANMKLLIVVDKLLTGFDAPSCTYLYIDKSMQDHGLFQAICRTNRLDGDDKDFGYIVDYKNLLKKVENAIAVYTSELDHEPGTPNPEILLKERLRAARERLYTALEAVEITCEPVQPPKDQLDYMHYFCGNTENPDDLQSTAPKRQALYQATAALVRAYSNLADEMEAAGFDASEGRNIKSRVQHFADMREVVKLASGEYIDLKSHEPDMRQMMDRYIEAEAPTRTSDLDNVSLIELIVESGIADAIIDQLSRLKNNKKGIAEAIENNIRSHLIKNRYIDPKFYEDMSKLLNDIIEQRRAGALEYQEYLARIARLAEKVQSGEIKKNPDRINTPELRALYNSLDRDEQAALDLDNEIKEKAPDSWRDNRAKEEQIKQIIYGVCGNEEEVERLFTIIKEQRGY